jgi:MFS family permease
MSALCVPQIAVLTFAAVFLHDFSGAGVAATGATITAVQAGAAVARVWSGRWTDRRRNRRPYLRACSVLTALVFAVLAVLVLLAASGGVPFGQAVLMPAILTALIVGGICASAWHGIAFTELATIAGASRAGTALGLGNTLVFAMYFVVPLGIPAVLSLSSWAAVWAIAGVCALSALPLFPRPDAHRYADQGNP